MRELRPGCVVTLLLLSLNISHPASGQQLVVDTIAANGALDSPQSLVRAGNTTQKLFFAEKNRGAIRVIDGGLVRPEPFVTIPVTGSGKQGLLSLAVHPSYPDSPFVYALYTRPIDRATTLSRYRDSAGVGVRPVVLYTIPRIDGSISKIGERIQFGPFGKLYLTIGEYSETRAGAQNRGGTSYRATVLRMNADGSKPADNPMPNSYFWADIHRSSFEFTFDRAGQRAFATNNGSESSLGGAVRFVPPLFDLPGTPALSSIALYDGAAFPGLRDRILVVGSGTPSLLALAANATGDSIAQGTVATIYSCPNGFTEVETDGEGNIYLLSQMRVAGSRILRLRPVPPRFVSSPESTATQGVLFLYAPVFAGATPSLSLVGAPRGMTIDSATQTIRWTPTNEEALGRIHEVTVRAGNGGGFDEQTFVVDVKNVNDPPERCTLEYPVQDTVLTMSGDNTLIQFEWLPANDPDMDPLTYTLDIDTTEAFSSPNLISISFGSETSGRAALPRVTRTYVWRVRVSDSTVSVATHELRRFTISAPARVKEVHAKRDDSTLEQNFPNPFNPSTLIKYAIPRTGHVHLGIFNLLGQEVAVLFEGTQSAGDHEFEFRNTDLPSGIYFYRISAPDLLETKKMTITK